MPKTKVALVLGITGQDGAHLASHLLDNGWTVYGGFRRGSSNKTWRMDYLGIRKHLNLVECQLSELQNLFEILNKVQPAEVYNLAGESFVADSFKYPGFTVEVNTLGALNILEAVRLASPDSRLFCASTSEIFGRSGTGLLNEKTECTPVNPYGISRLAAQHFARLYRERHGLYACSGILFNHEGPLRGREYVTRKIAFNIARLKVQGGEPMELGNLDAARDWGAAQDYVVAMRAMLALDTPEDLVIATGRLTTVREALQHAALAAGFSPVFDEEGMDEICVDERTGTVLARVSEKYFRPYDTPAMAGDASRIRQLTGWPGSRSIEQLIADMVEADIERWGAGITNV